MRQICNIVYHEITDGKTKAQITEVEVALTDPRDRAEVIERQNVESMRQLQSMGASGFIPPPPRRAGS